MNRAIGSTRITRGVVLAAAAAALVAAAHAVEAAAGGAAVGVEQRVRDELRALMAELVESGAFGDRTPQQIALDVEAPPQRVGDLGLIVDSAHADDGGLRVLAVTPNGRAERIGLRAGDVLVALNGMPLTERGAASKLRETVDALPDGAPLTFRTLRDGRELALSGTLSIVYLPAMHLTVGGATTVARADTSAAADPPPPARAAADAEAHCGRISDFDVAPRQQQLHAAKIVTIDGRLPGPDGARSYRVAVGTHELKVAEHIEGRYLSFNDRLRNAGAGDHYKTLTVDVTPDTTVLVAARLNRDALNQWQNGAYWDPVAWKQIHEPCR
ncbi:MAG TPA: PDZ domain-containing protein [Dokdonella sp.]